jgi:hypothetical protein
LAGKKQEYGDQVQGDGKEEHDWSKQLPDAHNEEFQDQLRASTPEIYFEISMMVVDFQWMW